MFTVHSCESMLQYFALSNTETPGISKKAHFQSKRLKKVAGMLHGEVQNHCKAGLKSIDNVDSLCFY